MGVTVEGITLDKEWITKTVPDEEIPTNALYNVHVEAN